MFRTLQREANANNKVTRSVERQNAAYARMAARTRAGAMQTVPTRPVGFAPLLLQPKDHLQRQLVVYEQVKLNLLQKLTSLSSSGKSNSCC